MMSASMLLFPGSALPQSRSTTGGHAPDGVEGSTVDIGGAERVWAAEKISLSQPVPLETPDSY